ncbi:MAG TPA: tetratricopeptide repeat protein [Bacteroidia bacterium]|nr:tetratricopeptide repeat protein [Bacteroidia bacterium]
MSGVVSTINFDQQFQETEKVLQEDPRAGFTKAQELLEQCEASTDVTSINKAKELLSRSYQSHGNYHKALQVCLEALQYFESIEDYAWSAKCLNNLGAAYNFLGEFENRLQTNLTCLSYRRKGGDEQGEISTLSNIGDSYNSLGNHDKALEYFNLCLEFSSISERTKTIVIHNLGETEYFMGNFEKAHDYFVRAIALAKSTSYYIIEQVAYVFIAKIHLRTKNFAVVQECLDTAEKIALDKKYKAELPAIFDLRAKCAEQSGEFENASRFYKQYIELSQEIRKENDTRAMQDMQFAYRVEKLQEENKVHKEKNKALRQAYLKITEQHRVIEEKNRSITDSINYALKIQNALLPSPWRLKKAFPDSFVFNQPRDIVSGDFYWLHENETRITLALADCTGHGVPGALVSIVGIDCLNLVINDPRAVDPGAILTLLDEKIASALNMGSGVTNSSDGMDISLLQIDKQSGEILIASANRPVFLICNGELTELKPDKLPIGEYLVEGKTFTTQKVNAKSGDRLYLFSDGYPDQFGGIRGKKLKLKGFREFIRSISAVSMEDQDRMTMEYFSTWKGHHEQLDDVCVMGITLP